MSSDQRIRAVAHGAVTPARVGLRRLQTQPTAFVIARLAVTAVLAFEFASWLPDPNPRPVLAPLTAILVVQITLFQTIRHVWQRVVSVVVGVMVAALLSSLVGFSWWSLGLAITAALICGFVMRLGNYILEVPISAMLILSIETDAAATGRIVETLVGALTGLVAGILTSPVRIQAAEEALEGLSGTMARHLHDIADAVEKRPEPRTFGELLSQARSLSRDVQRVDGELAQAEESIRLNPQGVGMFRAMVALRETLAALEHCGITIRGLARCLADHANEPEQEREDPLSKSDARSRLATALGHLASAMSTYGRMRRQQFATGTTDLGDPLAYHLGAAHEERVKLGELLWADSPDWPLHGELLVHLDRLRTELEAGRRMRTQGRPTRRLRIPKPSPPATLSPIRRRADLRRART
ncbi:FUSC family protein [Actinomadura citrea]|uniref:Putative membrane protein YccC n=1 Tax=Actinomadura citrea TaxID=46158 RepID=A0A7Y9KF13_9ACTN|nr:FUSC family protein [Actinomadura citrea]NYE13194.1 putative membrane protein YccC [Actinomadura citrea]GGU04652.1 FUSC family protein [Actinomadura citrea]